MSNSTMHYAFIHMGRLMRRFLRNRSAMVNTFIIPSIMMVVMRVLFGDLIAASQHRDTPDLMPIMIMMMMAAQWMMSTNTASESIRLRATGLDDRITVTPGGAWSLFFGQFFSYWLRSIAGTIPIIIVGVILGVRIHTGSAALLIAAIAVLGSLTTAAMSSWFTHAATDPESLMAATPLLMAVMFLSNGMVVTDAFVKVVQPFVRNNPLGHLITMVLNADASVSLGDHGWISLVWLIVLTVVFGTLAVIAFRRRVPTT